MSELLVMLALVAAWVSGYALARAQHHRQAMVFFERLAEVARLRPITGRDVVAAWDPGQEGDDRA